MQFSGSDLISEPQFLYSLYPWTCWRQSDFKEFALFPSSVDWKIALMAVQFRSLITVYCNLFTVHATFCTPTLTLLHNVEIFLHKLGKQKVFFRNHHAINFLVSSFRLIWIPMLWIDGRYNNYCVNSLSAGTVFRRQNLTFTDVRFWRLNTVRAERVHD